MTDVVVSSRDRVAIPSSMVSISMSVDSMATRLAKAKLNLRDLGLPENGLVVIEAWTSDSNRLRFEAGLVSEYRSEVEMNLSSLTRWGSVTFRVKVVVHKNVVKGATGRLSARGDRSEEGGVWENNDGHLISLSFEDIGDLISDVRIVEEGMPVIVVNSKIKEIREKVSTDPIFQGEIVLNGYRRVLDRLLDSKPVYSGDWRYLWAEFCRNDLNMRDCPFETSDRVERDEWVNDAVLALSVDPRTRYVSLRAGKVA